MSEPLSEPLNDPRYPPGVTGRCKRGHDMSIHAKYGRSSDRIVIICGECKRLRDRAYRAGRKRHVV